ncbi:MAG: hypothetical protein J07HB67_02147 [halophilic archaeon J07HB67]|nr:MAG: hypothetical protein J07HB67_02147 [halophilic archaeon J07HB67]
MRLRDTATEVFRFLLHDNHFMYGVAFVAASATPSGFLYLDTSGVSLQGRVVLACIGLLLTSTPLWNRYFEEDDETRPGRLSGKN